MTSEPLILIAVKKGMQIAITFLRKIFMRTFKMIHFKNNHIEEKENLESSPNLKKRTT